MATTQTFPEARTPDMFGNWQCDECGDNVDEYRFSEEELADPDELILCEGWCLAEAQAEAWANN